MANEIEEALNNINITEESPPSTPDGSNKKPKTVKCKVCDETVILNEMKNHHTTPRHIEAQKEKRGEIECTICKEKFVCGYWKQHIKTKTHILIARQKKVLKKVIRCPKKEINIPEVYKVREGSEENQQHIDALTTFLALRFALSISENFKFSINNDEWSYFGDIVFEFTGSEKTRVEAIRCKKIVSKNNFTILALSAVSGKLSLKEQCEILQQLRNTQKSYDNAYFKLHTVSNIIVDENAGFSYDDELMNTWEEKDKEVWKNRKVEIRQSKSGKKDLFNTTGDCDDVYMFNFASGADTSSITDLNKFRMYTSQKNVTELKTSITSIIENKFSFPVDVSDSLIKYIQKRFRTNKIFKKNEQNLKLTREDILLKTAELLLVPFVYEPNRVIKEIDLDLWNATVHNFDIVLMPINDDVVDKIFSGLNFIAITETNFDVDSSNKIVVKTDKIKNEHLKSKFYDFEDTLKSLYLALWKSNLIPLVLKAETEKDLTLVFNVIRFLKKENFSQKFIIMTNVSPVENYFLEDLKLFLNLDNLKFLDNEILELVLAQKIKILDSKVSLKEIDFHNSNFLEKLTPDVLLNIILDDFSFVDVHVPMTKDLIDDTIVLDDAHIKEVQNYYQKRDEEMESELSYLVGVEGYPTVIRVPPEL